MTVSAGPLEGLRVIELGVLLAGPFCGQLLGNFGAEVIKIEPPDKPDPMRDWGHVRPENEGLWFPILGRNKKCATLDLRKAEGQKVLKELVAKSDFLLEKDPLFARITLSGDEFALYQRIYDALRPHAPVPDLVVYLQAQPAILVERVRRRAAPFERGITDDYLALLAESYARFFYHYDASPVLIVNSENLNFVEREDDFELLVAQIRGMKSRREFFNLG